MTQPLRRIFPNVLIGSILGGVLALLVSLDPHVIESQTSFAATMGPLGQERITGATLQVTILGYVIHEASVAPEEAESIGRLWGWLLAGTLLLLGAFIGSGLGWAAAKVRTVADQATGWGAIGALTLGALTQVVTMEAQLRRDTEWIGVDRLEVYQAHLVWVAGCAAVGVLAWAAWSYLPGVLGGAVAGLLAGVLLARVALPFTGGYAELVRGGAALYVAIFGIPLLAIVAGSLLADRRARRRTSAAVEPVLSGNTDVE